MTRSRSRTRVRLTAALLGVGAAAATVAYTSASADSVARSTPSVTTAAGTAPTGPASTTPASTKAAPGPAASATAKPAATATTPAAGGTLPTAPKRAGALDFAPYTASFLAATADDERANAVGVGSDGTVIVGGSAGSAGVITRLDAGGQKVLSRTALPSAVEDLAVARGTGAVAVVGAFGLTVYTKTGTVAWKGGACAGGGADKSTGRRVDAADDGTVVTLCNHVVTTYSPAGAKIASWKVDMQSVDDVAVSGAAKLVYVGGGNNLGQLRVADVMAYAYTGGVDRWKLWGWDRATIGPDVADTFTERLTVGADGKLYFLGGSAGGNSIFHRDANAPSKTFANVAPDMFTNPYNTSSNNILYYARFDPASGKQLAGQFVITRNTFKGNKGNTIEGRAIAADATGRVVIGGVAAYAIEKRDDRTVCGTKLPNYGGDMFVLQTTPDLKTRQIWTALGGSGDVSGVVAEGGEAAAVASVSAAGSVTCRPAAGAVAKAAGGVSETKRDSYLTVWSPTTS